MNCGNYGHWFNGKMCNGQEHRERFPTRKNIVTHLSVVNAGRGRSQMATTAESDGPATTLSGGVDDGPASSKTKSMAALRSLSYSPSWSTALDEPPSDFDTELNKESDDASHDSNSRNPGPLHETSSRPSWLPL